MKATIPKYDNEKLFMACMALANRSLVYEPKWFRFSDKTKFRPDFYCPELDCYFEVVGNRQRYQILKYKIQKLLDEYPETKIKLVKFSGKKLFSIKEPVIDIDISKEPDVILRKKKFHRQNFRSIELIII